MYCGEKCNDKFKELMKIQHQLIQKKFDKYGLYRGQHIILFIIFDNNGISQKEIVNIMKVKPSTVSVSVKRLEKHNYIEKRIDPNDSRKTDIYLTDVGNDLVNKIRKEIADVHKVIYDGFNENEKEKLNLLFDKMITNLEKELENEIYKKDV